MKKKTEVDLTKVLNAKEFKKWLNENIGRRCDDFTWECFICRSWRLYDDIKGYVWFATS